MIYLLSLPRVILSIIPSTFLLLIIFILIKERRHLSSPTPIIIGILLLAIARGFDVLVEEPELVSWNWIHATRESLLIGMNTLGDFADAIGVFLLIFGFIQTIKYIIHEEERIRNLETLLPICATCKKIRKPDNRWETIEEYLHDSGAPPLTHGICPECKEEMLRSIKKRHT